jgi:two-component system cell cycle sensor histidine kinase/response regulator CckA
LLSGRYGFALHARARVREHLVPDYLRFNGHTPLRTVFELALSRTGDAFYEDVVLVNDDERLLGLVSTARLVRAQSELMMGQFEQLEAQRRQIVHQEKSVLVQTLAGGIAHEINNKLMPICGYTELMLAQAPEINGEFKGYCETIRECAFESAKIIRQLLELSRPSPPELVSIDLRQLVTDAVAFVQLRVRESDTLLRIDLGPEEVLIRAEGTKIKQVLVNLMLNALDAMEQLPAPYLQISLAREGGMAVLSVTDRGRGIAPENLTRLFDPFFTTKAPDRGTGLGLSVSQAIIEQHGGGIRVESVVGQGTTFLVRVPLSSRGLDESPARAQPPAAPGVEAENDAHGASLLIIDDEPAAAGFVRRALIYRLGCRAQIVANGSHAIERLEEEDYDVIISDVRMPGMNGLQLFEWLTERRPELVSRLMFTTGDASGSELNSRIAALGIPILQKPFPIGTLVREVRRLLTLRSPV